MLKTGIFGGSFNPIHKAHLAIANYLCEFAGLDELWFLVSPQNPLKKQEELLPDAFRLQLVQTAINSHSKLKASDFEFALPRPSYTINTLDALKAAYPNREFYLIIGGDNWVNFHRWYQGERLIKENRIIIYPRPGFVIDEATLPQTVTRSSAPVMDISSTCIRNAIKEGKDVSSFLHPEVYKLLVDFLHISS